MSEVDDAQDAENQRQPDAHQRVDAADQKIRNDELYDSVHRRIPTAG